MAAPLSDADLDLLRWLGHHTDTIGAVFAIQQEMTVTRCVCARARARARACLRVCACVTYAGCAGSEAS